MSDGCAVYIMPCAVRAFAEDGLSAVLLDENTIIKSYKINVK